jgi:hypothetical protein
MSSHSASPKFRIHLTGITTNRLRLLQVIFHVRNWYCMFITYPLLTSAKYPYRPWKRSLIDQNFTHAMDLRKYKEKQFFVGTAFWRIVWVTETGAAVAVDNGKKTQHNTLVQLGYLDFFFRCRPAPITFLLLFPLPSKGSERNYPIIGIPTLCPVLNFYTIKPKSCSFIILQVGFHPFYMPRRLLGWVEV